MNRPNADAFINPQSLRDKGDGRRQRLSSKARLRELTEKAQGVSNIIKIGAKRPIDYALRITHFII